MSCSMLPACSRVGQGELGHILHGKWTGGSEILCQPPCYPQAVTSGCMNVKRIPLCALHCSKGRGSRIWILQGALVDGVLTSIA